MRVPILHNYILSMLPYSNSVLFKRGISNGLPSTRTPTQVRERRLQLLPLFADFDLTHRLTVSQNQFRRVLCILDLAHDLTEREWLALYQKYRHPIGVIDNINYQAFMDDVYNAAGMDPRVPWNNHLFGSRSQTVTNVRGAYSHNDSIDDTLDSQLIQVTENSKELFNDWIVCFNQHTLRIGQ